MSVEVIRASNLGNVPHGFLGRRGGLSTGLYAGLNVGLGSHDDRPTILANREMVRDAVLPGATLVTVHQVHSADVVTVTAPIPDDARPPADALVTDRPGLLLGVLTADCVPILFADAGRGIIGAAHSGWKGALAGVGEATIAAMVALGAERDAIACAIGPCIGRASYEVSEAFAGPFLDRDGEDARFFMENRPGHLLFDIAGYVAARLASAGAGSVTLMDEDTYSQPERFFSYRRSCHMSEQGYGRQISVIGLPA
ncbi:MAG: peptidoglycan editing factor PgeF [Sphingobium sp.]|nr:peptidoglycan editing factor PgeF [Sphingobium sp.]